MLSKPYGKLLIKTTSSGTGGKATLSGFDWGSAWCGLKMVLKVFSRHRLLSLRRANYIVLGYAPDKSNQTAMAKALSAVLMLAPKKEAAYALTVKDGAYTLDPDGLTDAVMRFARQKNPVRIIGFPAYFKMFLDELNARGVRLRLPKNSKVLLGGGWKNLFADEVGKEELIAAAQETLGIPRENFKDHFSTAEHPVNYVSCDYGRFHVPAFARVIIRDPVSLEPVPFGTPGVLNLISPILSSAPYGSILTDDIAVLSGAPCPCGARSPHFEIIGRVGLKSVKTCTQAASEFLKKLY